MKFGSYVFEPQKAEGFDFHLLRVKTEVGKRIMPEADMHSNVAIFADNVATHEHPEWISQSPVGPARIGNNNFNIYWNTVCATQPEHRAEQLDYIEMVDNHSLGVWLNSFYFAELGNCSCPRCEELWKKSGLSWLDWRRKEVTDYVAQIRERVKNELILCVQPDPVNSIERYGVDFDELAKYADAFNVVMFSKNYATPWYWETLSRGFKKILKKPMYISLYVFGPGDLPTDVPTPAELLTVSVRCARAGIDGILYLTGDSEQIRNYQKAIINQVRLREQLRSYGVQPVQEVLDLISKWEKDLQ
ncbi:MAG: hypothetical protein N3D85_06720 [Candidatus Bathyarchaeota archaeon]|nr:hypothetical protein [Candidatus Bathyarchaeota archaeon]